MARQPGSTEPDRAGSSASYPIADGSQLDVLDRSRGEPGFDFAGARRRVRDDASCRDRVRRQFRFARLFYVHSWSPWAAVARRIRSEKKRNTFLSLFGPLSIIVLLAIWAVGLIVGFASCTGHRHSSEWPGSSVRLGTYAYFSGVTFFTLGYGDVIPTEPLGRVLAVLETGIGFGFLALVIGYLPVLYQAFSRREVAISLLDARAGSPPTAGTLLSRLARSSDLERLDQFLCGVGTLGGRGAGKHIFRFRS